MRVFITGASGQLGTALQSHLVGHDLALGDLPDLDVTDRASVVGMMEQFQPDIVIHCAAYTDVDGCARNPELAYRVNGLGTQNVALACLATGSDMVHISTNEVFAGDNPLGYEEWMALDPINPYARSKAVAEFHVRSILSHHYIVRTAWLYAPGGTNFVHSVLRAAENGSELRVVADEVGNPTYAQDLAAAIVVLIASGQYGTYHLVNEGACSRLQFARETLRLCGMEDVSLTPILSRDYERASRPPQYSALRNVSGSLLGITLRPWQEALAAYVHACRPEHGG